MSFVIMRNKKSKIIPKITYIETPASTSGVSYKTSPTASVQSHYYAIDNGNRLERRIKAKELKNDRLMI